MFVMPNAQNPPTFAGQAVADETDWAILAAATDETGIGAGCLTSALSLIVTGATFVGTTVTLTFATGPVIPTGSVITVAGITGFSTNNPNGTFTTTGGSATTVVYSVASAPTGAYGSGGTITGMVVLCAAGTAYVSGAVYTPAATYLSGAAASTNDRRDLVVYTAGTGYQILQGLSATQANYPVKPVPGTSTNQYNAATMAACGEVYVAGTSGTATTVIAATNLTDKTVLVASAAAAGTVVTGEGTNGIALTSGVTTNNSTTGITLSVGTWLVIATGAVKGATTAGYVNVGLTALSGSVTIAPASTVAAAGALADAATGDVGGATVTAIVTVTSTAAICATLTPTASGTLLSAAAALQPIVAVLLS